MLKNAFHIQYNGIIWKIRPDDTGQYLVCEIRHADERTTTFSCIHTASGHLAFNQLQLKEPWFCGLEDVGHGKAFLHGYLSETLPEHRGIFAVNLKNGSMAWENYNLVFDQVVEAGLIAWNYKSEPRRYELIDPADGSTIRSYSSAAERDAANSPLPSPPLKFPSPVSLNETWLARLPAGTSPVGDLLDWNDFRILSFYTPGEKGVSAQDENNGNTEAGILSESDRKDGPGDRAADGKATQSADHQIYVLDREGTIVHRDFLAKGILHRALDTFFVMEDRLYYIKSKAEILAYFL